MAGIVYEPPVAPAAPPIAPVTPGSGFSPQTFKDKDAQYRDLLASVLQTRTTGVLDGLAKVATAGLLGWQKTKNQDRADTERVRSGQALSKLVDALSGRGKTAATSAPSLQDAIATARGAPPLGTVDTKPLPPIGAAPPVGGGMQPPMESAQPMGYGPGSSAMPLAPEAGVIPTPTDYTVQQATGNLAAGAGQDQIAGGAGTDMVYGKLPPDMVRMESGGRQFDRNGQPLTSPAGAIGIAQVMPATGPEAAQLAGLPWDEQRFRNDPQYNEALGAAYYQAQLGRYGGDPELARAAYNAGPGRTDQFVNRGRPLPAETVKYADMNGDGLIGGGTGQDAMRGGAGPDTMPAPQQSQQQGPQFTPEVMQAAFAILSDPWADEGQKQVAGMVIGQALKMDQPINGIEVNNRLVNPRTGQVMADFSQQQFHTLSADEKAARGLPAEGAFQIGPDGKVLQIGGSGTTINLNTASNQEAIRTADQGLMGTQSAMQALDRALELNDQAASGPLAGAEQLYNRLFDSTSAAATTEMNTLITQTALDQLKVIFGGNPTEGERKILLDMQGAGNLTHAERRAVLQRAKIAVENRMRLAGAQSRDLRTGDYYKPGYQPPMPATTPAAPSAGVPQQVAPPAQPSTVLRYDAQGNRIQ
ncbi:transglycosylase SLT domain-containing protein [Inquilinus limosus]|uniref:transglycosylase SLT domain-containing protein n=1 Tax=Inquilinus limosus TaxID=171674 RepID=UPI000690DB02|nr:transglycosylase SLT domain-containing protein [Inquilinus limosus]